MIDNQLRANAEDELLWDPKVDAAAIAVVAHDGVITLRGTVGSFHERREATRVVKRVYGTKSVDNQLQVKLLNDDRRSDAELRGAILQALMLDTLVPDTVDAKVKDGVVTLTGTATYQFQRDEAESVAGNLVGVIWVDDAIELVLPSPAASDVKHSITKAIERDARLDAQGIEVENSNGTVKLSGSVRSWAEHDAAVVAAWAAPGVSKVDDNLFIAY